MIRNEEYCGQIIDWTSMKYGKTSFTDVDMSIDWNGEWFTFVEVKYMNAGLTKGQRIHLEHLCNMMCKAECDAVAVYCTHGATGKQRIDAGRCLVQQVYDPVMEVWVAMHDKPTLREFMERRYNEYVKEKEG